MKNILAENMRRFRTKNLNEQEQTEQTQKWPRWNANITDQPHAMYSAAAGRLDEIASYFVIASALYDEFKNTLESDGWVETKPNEIQFNNWTKWQQSHSMLMAVVKKKGIEGDDSWKNNVDPTNIKGKGGAWESADKKHTVYASTWNSFDEWLDTGKTGLLVRACSTSAANYKSCNAKPVAYNGGKFLI